MSQGTCIYIQLSSTHIAAQGMCRGHLRYLMNVLATALSQMSAHMEH
uniref:Uncharacterized protein n=1 Tax=Arundo donax TaxID=35708 RepID=A0A0A9FAJ6_ARUDO